MKTFTVIEAAVELNLSESRILRLCRQKRLGQTLPRLHGRFWIITQEEIDAHRAAGPRPAGRPEKKRQ